MPVEKTPGWLDWYADPSLPRFPLPPGAVDAHCHVFGPADRYPFASERKYTPCDASAEQLFALRDRLGFSRNVIVQATCHGADNSAMLAAVAASDGRARGVATVRPGIGDDELRRLDEAGVRGVRFNFVRRLVDVLPTEGLRRIADQIATLGWHIVLYFEAAELPDLADFFTSLPVPLVVDHMGRPDVTHDPDGPQFAAFLDLMRAKDDIWCKVTCPERLSRTGPPALPVPPHPGVGSPSVEGGPGGETAPGGKGARGGDGAPGGEGSAYRDVVPFARRVVEEFPDRVLWGTDWPHPNLTDHMPDDGLLVDWIPSIAPTLDQQRKLVVDNPMRLYWPEEATT